MLSNALRQLMQAYTAAPADSTERLKAQANLHGQGIWIDAQGMFAPVSTMTNKRLLNLARFQFKVANAMLVRDVVALGQQLFVSAQMPFGLILQGEHALETINWDLETEQDDWDYAEGAATRLQTIEDHLRSFPIVPHIYLELKRRNLLSELDEEQRGQLERIAG